MLLISIYKLESNLSILALDDDDLREATKNGDKSITEIIDNYCVGEDDSEGVLLKTTERSIIP